MSANGSMGSPRWGPPGRPRGDLNERRALDALLLPIRPEWIVDARAATPDEDARGIDIVVTTDVGEIPLQVKSSKRRRAQFCSRFHGRVRAIACVAVSCHENDGRVLRRIVEELGRIRARRLVVARIAAGFQWSGE